MKFNRLVLITVISLYALLFSTAGGDRCVSGFPIDFWRICYDAVNVSTERFIVGFILDFLFWFVVVYASVNFLSYTSKLRYLKYFINPIFLTILGFVIHTKCDGFICFSEGYGYPMSYYNNGDFFLRLFLIDLGLLGIFNFIVLKIINFIKRKASIFIVKIKDRFYLSSENKKVIFLLKSYFLFFLISYVFYFLDYFIINSYDDFMYYHSCFVIFIFIPSLSLIILNLVKNVFINENKKLYLIHIIIIILYILLNLLFKLYLI